MRIVRASAASQGLAAVPIGIDHVALARRGESVGEDQPGLVLDEEYLLSRTSLGSLAGCSGSTMENTLPPPGLESTSTRRRALERPAGRGSIRDRFRGSAARAPDGLDRKPRRGAAPRRTGCPARGRRPRSRPRRTDPDRDLHSVVLAAVLDRVRDQVGNAAPDASSSPRTRAPRSGTPRRHRFRRSRASARSRRSRPRRRRWSNPLPRRVPSLRCTPANSITFSTRS